MHTYKYLLPSVANSCNISKCALIQIEKKWIWEGDKGGYGSGGEKIMLSLLFVLYKNM